MPFAQDKKVQHSSTALRNVLADKEQTQSKLGATLAAMEEEMAEREAGWEAERGGLQAMLAAKERELVRSHCLWLAFACVGFRNGQVLTCCLRLAVCRRQCEGPRLRRAGRSQEKSGTPSSSSSSSSFNSRQRQRRKRRKRRKSVRRAHCRRCSGWRAAARRRRTDR